MTVFERLQVARFIPKGRGDLEVRFPVQSIQETGGNRVVERERPYRDGAKLDDTGSKAKRWTLICLFENTIKETGLEGNPEELYPGMMNKLIEAFDVHETGTLVLPTRGRVRVRAESYTRDEANDTRDAATLSLSFVADNEDSVDVAAFNNPTANSQSRRLGESTVFDAQSSGAWDGSLQDFQEFASELEALVNAPGDAIADIDSQVAILGGATNRVLRVFSDPSRDGRDVLTDPDSSSTQRKLAQTKDIAYQARADARRGRPNILSLVFERPLSLFDIASEFGQAFEDLLAINGTIEDVLAIPAGTVVRVFEDVDVKP